MFLEGSSMHGLEVVSSVEALGAGGWPAAPWNLPPAVFVWNVYRRTQGHCRDTLAAPLGGTAGRRPRTTNTTLLEERMLHARGPARPAAGAPRLCLCLVLLTLSCAAGSGPSADADDHGGVIAYCRQPLTGGLHQIFAINADGTDNHLLVSASIGLNHHDWSPDGQRLAAVGYVASNTWSIYTFNADGTRLTRLTTISGILDSDPAWSPDGTRIAFTRILPDQGNREEIWMMNADGSGQRFIGIQGMAAEWSPDGSRLIYMSGVSGTYGIYTANPDGTDEQRLTNTAAGELFPAFSPDGTRIAYASAGGASPADMTRWDIYVMYSDGSGITRLTDNEAYDSYPKWSPDGSRIAFGSDRHQTGKWEVYVMNSDGSGASRLTTLPAGVTAINPVWRPAPRP